MSLLLAAVSCGTRSPRPVDIDAADLCAHCRMVISENRYAAELADRDGNVIKFDNLDCMTRYAAAHGGQSAATAWWVMDSEGNEWLDLRQAVLVKSDSIPGPMGSGILATRDPAGAQDLAARFSGRILRFEDLIR